MLKSSSEIIIGIFDINILSKCSYGIVCTPNFLASPSAHFNVNLVGLPGITKLSFNDYIATSASVIEAKTTNAAPLWVALRSLIT